MAESADVIVIGAGVTGASVARALSLRGAGRVLVLERGSVGGGGTGKSSGIVRCHYGVPALAAMAWWSLPFFEHATDLLGADVGFRQVGYLVGVDGHNAAPLRTLTDMQRGLGIPVEVGDPGLARELWPGMATDDLALVAYEPRGGYADPYSAATAMAAQARAAGATIRQRAPVTGLVTSADGSRVRGVRVGGDVVEAPVVVLAAGMWSVPVAAGVGVDLPLRSMWSPVLLVDQGAPLPRVPPVFSDLALLQYSRPEGVGRLLLGNSDHADPQYADPDEYPNRAGEDYVATAIDKLVQRFPVLADGAVATSYAGCYDVTPDYNPVIGPAGPAGLVVAAGFSGHGFKISPAVGALAADLVCGTVGAVPGVDPAVFRLERFAEGHPLRSDHLYRGAGEMR